jgi:hypothetical protein
MGTVMDGKVARVRNARNAHGMQKQLAALPVVSVARLNRRQDVVPFSEVRPERPRSFNFGKALI